MGDAVAPRAQDEAAIDGFLRERGWSRAGIQDLDVMGEFHAIRYLSGACAAEIRVMLLPLNGEATGLAGRIVGPGEHLFFVHNQKISDEPSSGRAYLMQKLMHKFGRLSETTHLPLFRAPPYLAVAAPLECHAETAIPWHLL